MIIFSAICTKYHKFINRLSKSDQTTPVEPIVTPVEAVDTPVEPVAEKAPLQAESSEPCAEVSSNEITSAHTLC